MLLMSKLLEFSLEMKAAARMKLTPEGRYMKDEERKSVSCPERKCWASYVQKSKGTDEDDLIKPGASFL